MGLYRRNGSQFYWMSFRIVGRRVFESTGTANKKLAERIYSCQVLEAAEGKWFEKKRPVELAMSELVDRYMREVSPNLMPSTQERNRYMTRNLMRFFASYQVREVTPSIVSKYKAEMLETGYNKQTIVRELGLLRRMFNIAIWEWELCDENPVCKVLRALGKVDNRRVRYLNPGEWQKLHVTLPTWMRPIAVLARHTGLRRGSLLELTWQQIDFQRKLVTVPKTKNGEPIGIPLTETAIKTLGELQRRRYLQSPYIFCDREGEPIPPKRVSVAFGRACKRAGIENLRFHDLRHDFASNLVQAGVDIYTVKELLGHKDLRMTTRYCHLHPEKLREAIRVLDREESGDILVTVSGKKGVGALATT